MSVETAEVPEVEESEQQTEAETPTEPSATATETPEEGGEQQAPEADAKPPEPDDVEITIGDSPVPKAEPAPEWVRELRKQHREAQRRIKELEAERAALKSAPEAAVPTLGKKPTLADVDYDEDRFEAALSDWHERKRKIDDAKQRAEAEAKKQQEAWQHRLSAYSEGKAKLALPDFDEAEAVVQDALSQTQQSILLHGCENAALVVAALGKAPAKAKELGAITDPVSFAFAVAKLESQIKMTTKQKTPPPPEKKITSGSRPASSDKTLDSLYEEAMRTGDMSKVLRYQRERK
jgi:hypothetical protein